MVSTSISPEDASERIDADIDTALSRDPREPVASFAEAGLAPALVRALARRGITEPFPIQAAVLPDALAGEHILARAQTGSGKTLGFGLPLLTELARLRDLHGRPEKHEPRGLVLVPTRELAHQVQRELDELAESLDVSTCVVTGGAPYRPQQDALRRRVDLVIATPGRLIDLVNRGDAYLDGIAITVLDEADHMAELGFLEDMVEILGGVPGDGQRMLFSATLDRGVDVLVREFLPSPVLVAVDPESSPVESASHHVFHVPDWRRKRPLVAALANGSGRTLVFVRTQLGAERVTEELQESGVDSVALHGGMSQGARTRAMKLFMNGRVRVLVATDVAARGIHVDDIDVVIQADPTSDTKTYLHRAGRTARAGNGGLVASVVMPREKRGFERLLKDANVEATVVFSNEAEPDVAELVGPPAPPPPPEPKRDREHDKGKRPNRDGKPHRRDDRFDRRDDRPRRDDRRDDRPRRDDRRDDRPRDGYRKDDFRRDDRRDDRPRSDDRRDYRPREDRPRDDRPRDNYRRDDAPRSQRRDDGPRDSYRRDDRPRDDRPRDGYRRDDRPRDDRPRREAPSSESRSNSRPSAGGDRPYRPSQKPEFNSNKRDANGKKRHGSAGKPAKHDKHREH